MSSNPPARRSACTPTPVLAALLMLWQPASADIFVDGFDPARTGALLPSCYTDPDPLNLPVGYLARTVSWEAAFFGNAFPQIDAGGLAPVGSFTFANHGATILGPGIPMAGTYISIPFRSMGTYKLNWFRSQAVLGRRYRVNQPADAVFVTVSPCAGDFRLPVIGAEDERAPACRKLSADGSIFFGWSSQCRIRGEGYINIIFANPFDGLQPDESTCEAATHPYCNANFGD